jgi:prepilin-type N-terminal cleavage/methylation domain-containing protein
VRTNSGFTIIEMIVVLVLMTILAATVLGRGVTTQTLDLNSATEKLRNQIRYAQSLAMKRSDTIVWGIKSSGSEYWVFRNANPDTQANEYRIPGGDYPVAGNRINETDLGAAVTDFTIFFDRIGKPYTAYTSPTINTPLSSNLTITLSSGGDSRTVRVTPETGFVR